MSNHYMRVPWTTRLLPVILLLFTITLCAARFTPSASPAWAAEVATAAAAEGADACTGPVAGQRIYDCAHVLTSAEIANLETQAAAVERAGAPTIVYLQLRNATAQQTLQDAIDLMNRWNVESHPGAHDGFVMFFNVQPDNTRHGQVALYAGAKHYQHGNLPQSELDRIRVDVMTPLLQNGQMAAGIAAGLQMVAHDLIYGPPPPPAYRVAAATIGRIPFTVLGLLFAGLATVLFVRMRRQPPLSSAREEVGGLAAQAQPGELAPAMAGALVKGRVADAQVEATILDFARRGLLEFEPEGTKKVRVRLLGGSGHDGSSGGAASQLAGYERTTWTSLIKLTGGEGEMISSDKLANLRQDWGAVKQELQRELTERGWYDPAAASARRRPLYMLGALGAVGVVAGATLIVLSEEGWALIGLALFLGACVAAFLLAYAVHDTTVEGDIAAAPWRAYQASVTARDYLPNLDTDLPYIVALDLVGKLTPRLKAASERGYSPSWFRSHEGVTGAEDDGRLVPMVGFYPYWVAFHASAQPVSSGSASGGYAGGGAAGGGGGSAGGY